LILPARFELTLRQHKAADFITPQRHYDLAAQRRVLVYFFCGKRSALKRCQSKQSAALMTAAQQPLDYTLTKKVQNEALLCFLHHTLF
jgi:hypothetical protein